MTDTLVPLAEHFHSLQGEGRWSGLPMHFLRFPGCTVGRAVKDEVLLASGPLPLLLGGAVPKECHAYDGQAFFCDTDFDQHEKADLSSLVRETWELSVCFTGGEPLMHEQRPWYKELYNELSLAHKDIHIETSGTIIPKLDYAWITVSPKQGWKEEVIERAHQLKLLVTKATRAENISDVLHWAEPDCLIYFSPVFDPNELVHENVERAIELLKDFPGAQLTVQTHKWLGLR